MIVKIRLLWSAATGRYILVGSSVYFIELIIIIVAQRMGYSSTLSVAISFWVGLILSFFLQKLFTFQDKRMHHKIILSQIIATTLLILFNFGFTLFISHLLSDYLPAVITRTIAIGITTLWNFYLYRTRIFKNDSMPIID